MEIKETPPQRLIPSGTHPSSVKAATFYPVLTEGWLYPHCPCLPFITKKTVCQVRRFFIEGFYLNITRTESQIKKASKCKPKPHGSAWSAEVRGEVFGNTKMHPVWYSICHPRSDLLIFFPKSRDSEIGNQ